MEEADVSYQKADASETSRSSGPTSDKLEFKNWNDKLVNATSQSFGTTWRIFMKDLNRRLDRDRTVLDDEEINQVNGVNSVGDLNRISEDLYYVLVEKTEGDASIRVSSGETGDGLRAYMRLYLWFAGTMGVALTEKTQQLINGAHTC